MYFKKNSTYHIPIFNHLVCILNNFLPTISLFLAAWYAFLQISYLAFPRFLPFAWHL